MCTYYIPRGLPCQQSYLVKLAHPTMHTARDMPTETPNEYKLVAK